MADPQRGVSLRHLRLDLCDPEVVVLAIFNDRTYRDLPLLQRVWLGGDRLHLGKYCMQRCMYTIQWSQRYSFGVN